MSDERPSRLRAGVAYYRHLVWIAFHGAWATVGIVSTVVALLLSLGLKVALARSPTIAKPTVDLVNDLTWVLPLSVFLVVFVVRLVLAPFLAFEKEALHEELVDALKRQGERPIEVIAKLPDAQKPAGLSREWRDLAEKFGRLPSDLRGDWWVWDTQVDEPPVWEGLRGNGTKEGEALCRIAGNMLVKSPKIAASLSDRVRARTDALDRWLDYLKESYSGSSNTLFFEGNRPGPDETTVNGIAGQIERIGAASTAACLNCAAEET